MVSRSASTDSAADTVLVGLVLRGHGLRGEVKVEVISDVEGRFKVGTEFSASTRDGRSRRLKIASVRPDRATLLVRFVGVEDRDAADALRGSRLEVDLSRVPPPPDGLYYHYQLVDCTCHDRQTGPLGRVVEVLEDGGGELLRVVDDSRSLLIPFVAAYSIEVDLDAQRIDVDLPPGLIEACTSTS